MSSPPQKQTSAPTIQRQQEVEQDLFPVKIERGQADSFAEIDNIIEQQVLSPEPGAMRQSRRVANAVERDQQHNLKNLRLVRESQKRNARGQKSRRGYATKQLADLLEGVRPTRE